jgi:hypothetical protein
MPSTATMLEPTASTADGAATVFAPRAALSSPMAPARPNRPRSADEPLPAICACTSAASGRTGATAANPLAARGRHPPGSASTTACTTTPSTAPATATNSQEHAVPVPVLRTVALPATRISFPAPTSVALARPAALDLRTQSVRCRRVC